MIIIVTQFSGHPIHHQWERAYLGARDDVEQSRDVRVLDIRQVREVGAQPTSLAIHALLTQDVWTGHAQSSILASRERQSTDPTLSIGIAALGNDAELAGQRVYEWMGPPAPEASFWIFCGPVSGHGLRERIVEWLLLVIDRQAGRQALPYRGVSADSGSPELANEGNPASRPVRPFWRIP